MGIVQKKGQANLVRQRKRKKKGEIKLVDVANLAGVSPATVSRTLNYPDMVAKGTREKVIDAIATLDWIPHAGARALASHKTKLVGVIVATLGNPNIATALQAIENTLTKQGYSSMIVCDDLDPSKQISHTRMMIERGVDAIILHGEGHNAEVWDFLRNQDIPVVVNHTFSSLPDCMAIGYDAYSAFSKLTQHLLDLGHYRLGMMMLTSPKLEEQACRKPFIRMKTKHEAIINTLAEQDITIADEHITNTYFSLEKGSQCFRQIMSTKKPPTAIICMNDIMAIGASFEAKKMGIKIPKQLSIVGCDDLDLSAFIVPGLTTIRPPDEDMGKLAAQRVLDCLTQNKQLTGYHCLDAQLVIRDSTAPVPSD